MKKKTNKSRLTTREPLNVDALRDLASRKAAGVTTWPGWQVSIRTVLQAYLACVEDGHLEVAWSEWGNQTVFGQRRRSGREKPFLLAWTLEGVWAPGLAQYNGYRPRQRTL